MNVLLHICCANCAIYPVKRLREQSHEVTGYFFNHNIHPYQEFKKRLDTVKEYANQIDLPVTYHEDYLLEDFLAAVAGDHRNRCAYCYLSRLEQVARAAAEGGFDGFSSSLLYSRYQQHEFICRQAEELAQKYDSRFIYEDWRSGWQEGIHASKAMGLYRQQYCGCIYSEKERYCPQAGS